MVGHASGTAGGPRDTGKSSESRDARSCLRRAADRVSALMAVLDRPATRESRPKPPELTQLVKEISAFLEEAVDAGTTGESCEALRQTRWSARALGHFLSSARLPDPSRVRTAVQSLALQLDALAGMTRGGGEHRD